ncbi:MAG: hypothetical protein IE909_02655 [Campylobacterales bacterium]|nr:hypothetical protein [Campylobacterales bacterium]
MTRFVFTSLLSGFIALNAIEMPPMPPMIPMESTKSTQQQNVTKPSMPKSCELIPPMVIFLPPPMEAELVKCKNELFKPKIELVEKNLEKLLKKRVKVQKIEIVEKFTELYKVTYDSGVILTNKTVDGFIKQ